MLKSHSHPQSQNWFTNKVFAFSLSRPVVQPPPLTKHASPPTPSPSTPHPSLCSVHLNNGNRIVLPLKELRVFIFTPFIYSPTILSLFVFVGKTHKSVLLHKDSLSPGGLVRTLPKVSPKDSRFSRRNANN